jgi:hypothetical protein
VPAIHWINRPTFQQVVQLPVERVLDAYACYKARGAGAFLRRFVQIEDAFGTSSANLLKVDSFCTPVGVDGAPRLDPGARLTCYKTSGVRGVVKTRAGLHDDFGDRTVDVAKPKTLCVPTLADGVSSPLLLDSFRCRQASKPAPRFTRRAIALADAFGDRSALAVKPQQVCSAAGIDGEPAADPSAYLTCYRVSGVSPKPVARNVAITNDLGPSALTTSKLSMVCLPAMRTTP